MQKYRLQKSKDSQKGATLAVMLVIVALLILLINTLLTRYLGELSMSNQSYRKYQALNIAEAGVQKALFELNKTAGNYKGEKNTPFSNGQFTIEVSRSPQLGYLLKVTSLVLPNSRYSQRTIIQTKIQKEKGNWKILSWKE